MRKIFNVDFHMFTCANICIHMWLFTRTYTHTQNIKHSINYSIFGWVLVVPSLWVYFWYLTDNMQDDKKMQTYISGWWPSVTQWATKGPDFESVHLGSFQQELTYWDFLKEPHKECAHRFNKLWWCVWVNSLSLKSCCEIALVKSILANGLENNCSRTSSWAPSCTVWEHLLSPRSSVNLVSTVPELCSVTCSQQFPKGHDHHHIAIFEVVWSIIDAQLIENGRVVALCNQWYTVVWPSEQVSERF